MTDRYRVLLRGFWADAATAWATFREQTKGDPEAQAICQKWIDECVTQLDALAVRP